MCGKGRCTKMLARKLVFLIGFTGSLLLVSPVSAQNSAGLELSNPHFKQQQYVNFNPRFSVTRSGSDDVDFLPGQMRPTSRDRDKGIYSTQWSSKAETTAHNTSSKTIKQIVWAYVFFADVGMQQEINTYRIITKTKLRPGGTKTLTGTVFAPTRSPYQKVRLIRIEYTDGTVWQSS